MATLSLVNDVIRLSMELVRLCIAIEDSHLTRQLSDLVDEVELLRVDVEVIENFFDCTPQNMNLSSYERVHFKVCYTGAYAHAMKSKNLAKQINHTIWRVLGKGISNLPRWLHVGTVLFRLWMHRSRLAYLSERLSSQRNRAPINIQVLQSYLDRHFQNNFREWCNNPTPRPNGITIENLPNIAPDGKGLFSLPQPINSFYTGGAGALKELYDKLQSGSIDGGPQRRKIVFVVGEGGSGKTQLCSQFAERNRSRYSAVFWIDATSADEAEQAYCNTNGSLTLIGVHQGKLKRSSVMECLSSFTEPWLLIVDNIADVNGLSHILPGGDNGHILVTTKNRPDDETAQSIYLTGMVIEDARELLLRATQRMKPWTGPDIKWATAIVEQLRENPLPHTIVQIAATFRCGLGSSCDYIELYRESVQTNAKRFSGYSDAQMDAIAALEIAITRMKKQKLISSKDATKLAHVFPFFHSRSVSLETVQNAVINSRLVKARKKRWYLKRATDVWVQRRRRISMPWRNCGSRHKLDLTLEYLAACRTKWAIMELLDISLLIYDESTNTYSMPNVAREWIRSSMSSSDRGVWQRIADKTCGPTS